MLQVPVTAPLKYLKKKMLKTHTHTIDAEQETERWYGTVP